jgi:putative phosphoesterase
MALTGIQKLGVISDTHGLLRPEAIQALHGVDRILHAGDIGSTRVLEALNEIAPVTAIRGNVDREPWCRKLPETAVVEVGKTLLYIVHNLETLDFDLRTAGFSAVVYGHTHCASREMRNGILYFNPGSAGPRRFQLPVTIGCLEIRDNQILGEIVPLFM